MNVSLRSALTVYVHVLAQQKEKERTEGELLKQHFEWIYRIDRIDRQATANTQFKINMRCTCRAWVREQGK